MSKPKINKRIVSSLLIVSMVLTGCNNQVGGHPAAASLKSSRQFESSSPIKAATALDYLSDYRRDLFELNDVVVFNRTSMNGKIIYLDTSNGIQIWNGVVPEEVVNDDKRFVEYFTQNKGNFKVLGNYPQPDNSKAMYYDRENHQIHWLAFVGKKWQELAVDVRQNPLKVVVLQEHSYDYEDLNYEKSLTFENGILEGVERINVNVLRKDFVNADGQKVEGILNEVYLSKQNIDLGEAAVNTNKVMSASSNDIRSGEKTAYVASTYNFTGGISKSEVDFLKNLTDGKAVIGEMALSEKSVWEDSGVRDTFIISSAVVVVLSGLLLKIRAYSKNKKNYNAARDMIEDIKQRGSRLNDHSEAINKIQKNYTLFNSNKNPNSLNLNHEGKGFDNKLNVNQPSVDTTTLVLMKNDPIEINTSSTGKIKLKVEPNHLDLVDADLNENSIKYTHDGPSNELSISSDKSTTNRVYEYVKNFNNTHGEKVFSQDLPETALNEFNSYWKEKVDKTYQQIENLNIPLDKNYAGAIIKQFEVSTVSRDNTLLLDAKAARVPISAQKLNTYLSDEFKKKNGAFRDLELNNNMIVFNSKRAVLIDDNATQLKLDIASELAKQGLNTLMAPLFRDFTTVKEVTTRKGWKRATVVISAGSAPLVSSWVYGIVGTIKVLVKSEGCYQYLCESAKIMTGDKQQESDTTYVNLEMIAKYIPYSLEDAKKSLAVMQNFSMTCDAFFTQTKISKDAGIYAVDDDNRYYLISDVNNNICPWGKVDPNKFIRTNG